MQDGNALLLIEGLFVRVSLGILPLSKKCINDEAAEEEEDHATDHTSYN